MATIENGIIKELDSNEVFVFGSNGAGAHFGGAAATAVRKFGAILGQSEGLQGQSYGINSMDGLEIMSLQVKTFIDFAIKSPELTFYVTEIGCGIAGYSIAEVAPLFNDAKSVSNIILPKRFLEYYAGDSKDV